MPALVLASLAFCSFAALGCDERTKSALLGDYEPRLGDVIFQSLPRSELVDAIEGASKSPYSHCGLVVERNGVWFVLEANGPGVAEMKLDKWIRQGRESGFAVYRFTPNYQPKIDALIAKARTQIGKPYDIHYDFDDAKVYCSELIFKAFHGVTGEHLGQVRKLGDLDWKPHEGIIRKIERGGLPLEREMITPGDMAAAKQLQPVYRKGM